MEAVLIGSDLLPPSPLLKRQDGVWRRFSATGPVVLFLLLSSCVILAKLPNSSEPLFLLLGMRVIIELLEGVKKIILLKSLDQWHIVSS